MDTEKMKGSDKPVERRNLPIVSILMYHQVGRFTNPCQHRAVYCDVERFRWQMAYLKYGGHQVISMQEAYQGLFLDGTLPPRPVVLTFDDGYQNFQEYAWPILQQYGYPATVYLVSNLIGRRSDWFEFDPDAPLMSEAHIKQLYAEGVSFGSHTCSHCHLSKLTELEQRQEINESKERLENLIGTAITDFCYPYGDYNLQVRDLVEEAGYLSALTCIRGAANTASNPFEIPRKAISYGDNLLGFFWKLKMKNARKDSSHFNPEHVVQGCFDKEKVGC